MIEKFLSHLQAQGRSKRTTSAYKQDLLSLSRFLEKSPESATPADLDSFFSAAAFAPATRNRMLSAFRQFYGWLLETCAISRDPTRLLKSRKVSSLPKNIPGDAEVAGLLKTLRTRKGPLAERDELMVRLMVSAGLRVSEVASLERENIDLFSKHVTIRGGKGAKDRVLFLSLEMRDAISRYLKKIEGDRLFSLTTRMIEYRVSYWIKEAGIGTRTTPHSLRHFFATRLLRKSSTEIVRRALGHASMNTTAIYLHLDDRDLQKAMEAV